MATASCQYRSDTRVWLRTGRITVPVTQNREEGDVRRWSMYSVYATKTARGCLDGRGNGLENLLSAAARSSRSDAAMPTGEESRRTAGTHVFATSGPCTLALAIGWLGRPPSFVRRIESVLAGLALAHCSNDGPSRTTIDQPAQFLFYFTVTSLITACYSLSLSKVRSCVTFPKKEVE